MKVGMYYNNKDVRVQEMEKPEIGTEEFLMKTAACGVCGTDVLEWYRIKTAPKVLGHEAAGEIVETGKGVRYKVGDRVFVSHHVPCDNCHFCRNGHHTACETLHATNFYPGGFSQYIRIPKINVEKGVYVLPEGMTYEEGTMIEPLACVCRGQRIASLKPGQTVLVIGSGIAGLLHVKLAKARGAGKIIATDVNEYRLKKAKEFGADFIINARDDVPSKVKELNGGLLADMVILCTGAVPAMKQSLASVGRGGTILFFAVPEPGIDIPIPVNEFWRNEIRMFTSYGAAPVDLDESFKLISGKKVKVSDMITHRLPLSEIQEGFRLVAEAKDSLKVIIKPNE
jgi:L-iditol 2-dehydrogenase